MNVWLVTEILNFVSDDFITIMHDCLISHKHVYFVGDFFNWLCKGLIDSEGMQLT